MLRPGFRTRLLGWLARRFGIDAVLPFIVPRARDSASLRDHPEARDPASSDERSHARIFALAGDGRGLRARAGAVRGPAPRRASGNALRAAVLGANDGLLSNFSLVMGVAGAALGRTRSWSPG